MDYNSVYRINSNVYIPLPYNCRTEPLEILFDSYIYNNIYNNIIESIIECIKNTNFDMRRLLIQNIMICGGVSCTPGFFIRFANELYKSIENDEELCFLSKNIGFANPTHPRNEWIWLGGSIYGSMEGILEYTAAQYQSGQPIPDWLD
eukprot:GHVL01013455.1.p1 GENE.GHVL01013455.1~~GHVL01013455.1.p1  ORF type:complete len:148 (+),score=47.68 GHVL01013455.1:379-822(+)